MSEEDNRNRDDRVELPHGVNSACAPGVAVSAGAGPDPAAADAATRRRRGLMLLALWESGPPR